MVAKKKTAKNGKKPIQLKLKKDEAFFDDVPKQKVKMNVGVRNAMEEVQEILSPCIKCGMCKSLCPVFKTLKKEEISPRGHAIMLNENILNELVFQCNLCKACENKCPLNLKICDAMKRAREALVLDGKSLKNNEEMIEAIRKTGSPFQHTGKVDPDKLYCC